MTVSRKEAIAELWRRGDLRFLLRDYQRDMLASLDHPTSIVVSNLCSVRVGKTFVACVAACEMGRKRPYASIKFAYPLLKQAKDVVVPAMREVLRTCPKELRPTLNLSEMTWTFPETGAIIKLAGCDTEDACDSLRGDKVDLGVIDEAGFIDHLHYLIESVLKPRTITTNGKILITSSAPKSMGHAYRDIHDRCDAVGAAKMYTVDVLRPVLGDAQVERYLEEAGGRDTTTVRREYFCEFVTEIESAVVPEFIQHKSKLVGPADRPEHYLPMVAADFGFNDLTVAAFGYYHFRLGKVVIEDEVVCHRESASAVGRQVAAKERELWPGAEHIGHYADAPLQLLSDIYENAGVMFAPVQKQDADGALNHLRMYCLHSRLLIHPRCKTIISHLESAIWNSSRTSYDRSSTHGHFDGVDAVKYLLRHIDVHTNPEPHDDRLSLLATHWVPHGFGVPAEHSLADAFRFRT